MVVSCSPSVFLKKKDLFKWHKTEKRVKERGKGEEKRLRKTEIVAFYMWATHQMTATASAGLAWSQEPELLLGLPSGGRAHVLAPSSPECLLAGSGIWSGVVGIQTSSSSLGCRYCTRWLTLLCCEVHTFLTSFSVCYWEPCHSLCRGTLQGDVSVCCCYLIVVALLLLLIVTLSTNQLLCCLTSTNRREHVMFVLLQMTFTLICLGPPIFLDSRISYYMLE